MLILKSRWFQRFAQREGISDSVLKRTAELAESGLVDADLGGGVIKQRSARSGEGKSGGYRAILDAAQFVLALSGKWLRDVKPV